MRTGRMSKKTLHPRCYPLPLQFLTGMSRYELEVRADWHRASFQNMRNHASGNKRKFGILSLEPAQHGPKRNTATDEARYDRLRQPTGPDSHWPVNRRLQQTQAFTNQQGHNIKCQTRQKQLNQQHSNRVKRCDH